MDRYLEIGVDIVDIEEFTQKLSNGSQRFLNKIFTLDEQMYCEQFADPIRHYAGIFAAKESVYKALSNKIQIPFWKIEIVHTNFGQPEIHLPSLQNIHHDEIKLCARISISHDKTKAIAFAIVYDSNVSEEQIAQILIKQQL